jgi:hypothetical protein
MSHCAQQEMILVSQHPVQTLGNHSCKLLKPSFNYLWLNNKPPKLKDLKQQTLMISHNPAI